MRIIIESELTLEQIEIDGTIVPHYGLSKNGELFRQDKFLMSWKQVEVARANGEKIPTRVNINGESHSIVNLYMETFNISNSQSYRIIKRRYGSESHCIEYKEKMKPLNTTREKIFSDTWPTANIFAGGGR